jgi:hypothetical protein
MINLKSLLSFNSLGVLFGLLGTYVLSSGYAYQAQIIYCISNPLLIIPSYRAGCKQTAGLFLVYWALAIRGVLSFSL